MGTALRIVASEFAGVDEIGLCSFLESNLVTSVFYFVPALIVAGVRISFSIFHFTKMALNVPSFISC